MRSLFREGGDESVILDEVEPPRGAGPLLMAGIGAGTGALIIFGITYSNHDVFVSPDSMVL